MTINAIVFDLDGTLTEFNLDYKAVRAEAIQFFINRGFPASIFSMDERIYEMLEKAKVYFINNGKKGEFSALQKDVLSIARNHELKAARETSILPGVLETLKALKGMSLKLAIFTVNGGDSTNLILDRFRLRRFFDAIVPRELVSGVKPDPSHLGAALKALNVNADEAIVVGDSVVDMGSAKALKVVAVGIAATTGDVKKLSNAGAAHTIKSITDLPTLIAKLNQSIS
jgi:HAD superfamily hydrolase (TIGR01509 family)